jgi:hypothetical protein
MVKAAQGTYTYGIVSKKCFYKRLETLSDSHSFFFSFSSVSCPDFGYSISFISFLLSDAICKDCKKNHLW